MNLLQRYKRLSVWNKFFVLAGIASIISLIVGLPITALSLLYGPSEENIQAALKKALQNHESGLRMKYGENYSVAAITPKGFVVPKGEVPSGINVKWETGRVINVSSKRIEIAVPHITANTIHQKNCQIYGNIINLPKEIGAKVTLANMKDFVVAIEVIGIDQDVTIVGLGMAPN